MRDDGFSIKPLRRLVWLGNSRKTLKGFPKPVQKEIGWALDYAQRGTTHPSAKPLKGIRGGGVFEIIDDYDTDTYRAVYAVNVGEVVYILHVFQKKSKKGIKTPKQDIALILERLKTAHRLEEG